MITLVGMFAKSRAYVVQVREYNRRRRNPDRGWMHMAQFNYDGQTPIQRGNKTVYARVGDTKDQAWIKAHKFAHGLDSKLEYRIVNMTVKQAHKSKTNSYRPAGELRPLKREFDYDRRCRSHPTIPWVPNKRKTDEKIGATALATPETNHLDSNTKAYERLRRAMAYYVLAQNY